MDLISNYTTFGGCLGASYVVFSGSAERQQGDLRRNTDAHRETESSQSAIDIEGSFLCAVARSRGLTVTIHRQFVEPRHKRRNQPSRADTVIHDLELYLSTMSMPGEAEFDTQFRSAAE